MLKVLVVSERDLAPELGGTVLWAAGVDRLVAQSAAPAVEAARAFSPSLVVLDGADAGAARLVKRLRESPGMRRSSIVVAGAPTGVSDAELRAAGANLVLRSGTDPAECDETLVELLKAPLRIRTSVEVRFSIHGAGDGQRLWGQVLDAGTGGVLIEAPQAPQQGEMVDVSLLLPQGRELHAVGETVRVVPGSPARFGVRLVGFAGDAARRIRELLRQAPERSFGRYEVLGLHGEGAMGRVYRAYDPLARRVVALKTLRTEHLESSQIEDCWRRFRREAQAAARLVHPNIITIFDVGDEYFVMELLEGATLKAILGERGRLEPDEARRLLRPVAEAIDYAHAEGTIHRDIKPANILITSDGRPKVMDFGVAHLTSGAITASGQVFGSPSYMAPEQIESGEIGPPTDLFSLAVVAYETLTGRKPFEGEALTPILYNILNTEPQPPSQLNGALPPRYDEVFRRALAKDPGERHPNAVAFIEALDPRLPLAPPATISLAAATRTGTPAAYDPDATTVDLRSAAASTARRPFMRRRPWVAFGAAVAALGALVLGARLTTESAGVRTAPPPPGLQVSSVPPGATVSVDGAAAGTTPVYLTGLAVGPHALKVVAEGHAPGEVTVDLAGEGPPVPLRFDLQPLLARLQVESSPADATLEVDGKPAGLTPLSGLRLPAGTRRISIGKAGYRNWARVVDARPGETLEIAAQLEPTRDPPPRDPLRRQGWVLVGDLVELSPSVTPPHRLPGPPPSYPDAARKHSLRGTVTVELTVTETGAVVDAHIVQSAGEILDHALLEAAGTWRYEPAETNGVKVKVRIPESHSFEPGA